MPLLPQTLIRTLKTIDDIYANTIAMSNVESVYTTLSSRYINASITGERDSFHFVPILLLLLTD